MGHKINPTSIRLKITQSWKSRWFARSSSYSKLLEEDTRIREYLDRHLKKAGLVSIEIERTNNGIIAVIVKTTKPGLIIGRGGAGIEELKRKIRQKLGIKKELKVNIEEVRDINLQAQAIANSIAEQIEKRVAFRRLMKQSLDQIMNAGAKGAKVAIGGRLNGAEIARTEHLALGKIPLHTLRADIDFARSTAFTTYGTVGVKVWVYKGDVFEDKHAVAKSKVSGTEKD